MANDTHPLLTLPPELRNRIWDSALCDSRHRPTLIYIGATYQAPGPPLLQTCQQIRDDSLPMWYANTKFETDTLMNQMDFESCIRWLCAFEPVVKRCVRRVRFRVAIEERWVFVPPYAGFDVDVDAEDAVGMVVAWTERDRVESIGMVQRIEAKVREVLLEAGVGRNAASMGVEGWTKAFRIVREEALARWAEARTDRVNKKRTLS